MNELDKRAEEYMRSVMKGNHGDVFTRSDLYEYIIDAYKQGYCDRSLVIMAKPEWLKREAETLSKLILDKDTQDALKFADSYVSIYLILKSRLKPGQDNEHI